MSIWSTPRDAFEPVWTCLSSHWRFAKKKTISCISIKIGEPLARGCVSIPFSVSHFPFLSFPSVLFHFPFFLCLCFPIFPVCQQKFSWWKMSGGSRPLSRRCSWGFWAQRAGVWTLPCDHRLNALIWRWMRLEDKPITWLNFFTDTHTFWPLTFPTWWLVD